MINKSFRKNIRLSNAKWQLFYSSKISYNFTIKLILKFKVFFHAIYFFFFLLLFYFLLFFFNSLLLSSLLFSSLLFFFSFLFFSSLLFCSLISFLLFPYLLSSPLCFVFVVYIEPVLRWTMQYDSLLWFFSDLFTFLACRPNWNVLRLYSIIRHLIIWHLIFWYFCNLFRLFLTIYVVLLIFSLF